MRFAGFGFVAGAVEAAEETGADVASAAEEVFEAVREFRPPATVPFTSVFVEEVLGAVTVFAMARSVFSERIFFSWNRFAVS